MIMVSLVQSSRFNGFLFTFKYEVQNTLEVEQARSLYLAGFADGHAAEVPLPGSLVEFGTAEARVKIHALLG